MSLGERAKAARTAKGYSLADMCALIEDFGGGQVKPGTLKHMEDGVRPGENHAWGAIWRSLKLPLRELYEGLGLPVSDSEPGGTIGQLLSVVQPMNKQQQQLVLMFATHAPSYGALFMEGAGVVETAQPTQQAAREETEEERENRAIAEQLLGFVSSLKRENKAAYVQRALEYAARDLRENGLPVEDFEVPTPKTLAS